MIPHDVGAWGLIVGATALVLTFPLSLLANLVSPAVKDWWASRSRAGLAKRQDLLLARSTELSTVDPVSESLDWILHVLETVLYLGGIGIVLFGFLMFEAITADPVMLKHGPRLTLIFALTFAALTFVLSALTYVKWRDFSDYVRRVSPAERARIAKQIQKVEAQLAAYKG